jgi:CHAT domain-containing protein/tetratricopeptide (TPR) repeat protein
MIPVKPSSYQLTIPPLVVAQTTPAPAVPSPTPSPEVLKHYAEIEQRLELAKKKNSASDQADALYDLAVAHYNQHDYASAETFMKQAVAAEDALKRVQQRIQDRQVLGAIMHATNSDAEQLSAYNDALAIADENKLTAKEVDILLCLGQLSLNKNNLADADKYFQRADEAAKAGNLPSCQAQALSNLAVVARKNNDNKKAIDCLERAVKLTTQWEDTGSSFGPIYIQLGTAYADEGMLDQAVAAFAKAAKVGEEDGEMETRAKALSHLGDTELALQKSTEALANLQQAETLLSGTNTPGHVDCLIGLASAQADLGQFEQAKKGHTDAVELAKKTGYRDGALLALTELGYDDLLQGSQEKALNGFFEAYNYLSHDLPNDEYDKALLLNYIGMCYDGLGQTDAALDYQQQSADLFHKLGKTTDEAMAYNSIAVAYLNKGSFTEFKKYFDKAKQMLESMPTQSMKVKLSQAYLDYNYAQACICQAKAADALDAYQRAMAVYKEANDTKGQARVLCGIGLYSLQTGKPQDAAQCYEQAWELAGKQGDVETRWDCAVGSGKAYRALNNLPLAEKRFAQAIQIVESERKQMSRDTYKTFNLDWRQDCFQELSDILAASGRADEALEVAEKGRARAFLDLLEVRCRGRLFNGEVAKVDPGIGQVDSRPQLIALAGPTDATTVRGVSVIPKIRSAVEVSAISPVYAAPPTLAELKALVVKSRSFYVEYYVLPNKILVWVVTPDGTVKMPPPIQIASVDLTRQVKDAYAAIVTPPKSFADVNKADAARQAKLHELYKLLIAPVEESLPKSPDEIVTIVPHGPLFQVPFAALLTAKGQFLTEQHSLAYLPALGVLRATEKLESDVSGESNRLLAFGNPITKQISFLGALPYAEKEVHSVASFFPGSTATVEVGEQATKSLFRKLAPENSVIHLATHGLIDEEHPMDSAVVLAPDSTDDGLLTVRDILQLPPLKARLIVLSACQTGRGKITGDGVVGLSRAFIIAGTPSIIVSQWNVDDVMTEYQMKLFYAAFLPAGEKAKALRDAQVKTIQFMEKTLPAGTAGGEAIRANPRYWAAFELIGDYK